MNLHPVLVHFPIALLSLYTLIEIARFKKVTQHSSWFYLKAVLSITGVVGAFTAVAFGDTAVHAVRSGLVLTQVADPMGVIRLHENLAKLGTALFVLPAAGYTVVWLNQFNFINYLPGNFLKSIWKFGTRIQQIITETSLVIIIAIIGLVVITIAAALGGSIVYGPDNDPFVRIIYHIFFQ